MGMPFVQRYRDNSLVLGSAEFERLTTAARELGIWVSMGYSEKAGGSLYMGQALIDDQGNLVKTRRKLKPTHVERCVFGEGDGSDLAVMETTIGNVGMLRCWEHLQPLSYARPDVTRLLLNKTPGDRVVARLMPGMAAGDDAVNEPMVPPLAA